MLLVKHLRLCGNREGRIYAKIFDLNIKFKQIPMCNIHNVKIIYVIKAL